MIKFIRENKILSPALVAICALGLFFRLYHIEFGLPHSFYADEPEIAEPAIKYTYEFKDVVTNNNFYKLIPVSFVYVYLTQLSYYLLRTIFPQSAFWNKA